MEKGTAQREAKVPPRHRGKVKRFTDRDHAFQVIADWIDRYHRERPHSALGYLTPQEYREKLAA